MNEKQTSPLEEALHDAMRDCQLIISDIRQANKLPLGTARQCELKSALNGFNYVLVELTRHRDALKKALDTYQDILDSK